MSNLEKFARMDEKTLRRRIDNDIFLINKLEKEINFIRDIASRVETGTIEEFLTEKLESIQNYKTDLALKKMALIKRKV